MNRFNTVHTPESGDKVAHAPIVSAMSLGEYDIEIELQSITHCALSLSVGLAEAGIRGSKMVRVESG